MSNKLIKIKKSIQSFLANESSDSVYFRRKKDVEQWSKVKNLRIYKFQVVRSATLGNNAATTRELHYILRFLAPAAARNPAIFTGKHCKTSISYM